MYWRRCLTHALFAAFLVALPGLSAQTVTGRVIDQSSGQPLASVQVFVAGSGIGSLTQQNGRFLLVNVPVGIHSLTAERIGYRSVTAEVTVDAGGTTVQDFALSQEALGLDEIIVTGTPGGTQRRAIGNSVLSVSAADITQTVAVNNIQDLMGGRTPGLQMG
jgi:outer membrane receptor for ferrienterochelin and colicins